MSAQIPEDLQPWEIWAHGIIREKNWWWSKDEMGVHMLEQKLRRMPRITDNSCILVLPRRLEEPGLSVSRHISSKSYIHRTHLWQTLQEAGSDPKVICYVIFSQWCHSRDSPCMQRQLYCELFSTIGGFLYPNSTPLSHFSIPSTPNMTRNLLSRNKDDRNKVRNMRHYQSQPKRPL